MAYMKMPEKKFLIENLFPVNSFFSICVVSLPPCICFGNLSKTFKKLHFPLIFNFLLIFRKVLLSPIRNSCTLHVCKQSKFGETKTIVVQKHQTFIWAEILIDVY